MFRIVTNIDDLVKAFMVREIHTIGPDAGPLQAARKMVRHDIGRLPVMLNRLRLQR